MDIKATTELLNGVFDIGEGLLVTLGDGFQISDVLSLSGRVIGPALAAMNKITFVPAELKDLTPEELKMLSDLTIERLYQLVGKYQGKN